MLQRFVSAIRELFTDPPRQPQGPKTNGPLLDACVLEDRFLYSATAMPVDMVDGGSLDCQPTEAEVDALMSLVSQQIDGALQSATLDSSTSTTGSVTDAADSTTQVAALDSATLDGLTADGSTPDGTTLDGTTLDGTTLAGTTLDGTALDGTAAGNLAAAEVDSGATVSEAPAGQLRHDVA
ncbi:MAG: hypothetical protein ACTHOU_02700, partial [Aureliella sp.]